jgi:predicted nucleotidyltransferase component of viral defense system
MKKINAAQIDLIDALVAEYDIGGLNASILEKDIHVTDALSNILNIYDPQIQLIFCGGTSLSKAFKLIERMSEDIDIKIDMNPLSILSTSARRNYLGQYKNKLKESLMEIGFIEDPNKTEANNANHLFSMEWLYESQYQIDTSLRPRLKIDVKTCEIHCPTIQKNISYLASTLANTQTIITTANCQAIEETLSEKIISFLRRYDRSQCLKEPWDSALVRHIYDCYCIHSTNKEIIKKSKGCTSSLIANEVKEYGNQHESFKLKPFETLLNSLEKVESDATLATDYQEKLMPLIFGDIKPTFIEAKSKFITLAKELLIQ